jgi:SAM-dependent methyltransferase
VNGGSADSQITASLPSYVQMDEDGYFAVDGLRVADVEVGRDWLSRMQIDERGRAVTEISGISTIVEYYDEPFIALDVEKQGAAWTVQMPYGHVENFKLETLCLDEWDRFHGRTDRGVPLVLSRSTQARFFNQVDEFDDDSITVDGKRIETQPWLQENPDANQKNWWSEIYRSEEPRWDLKAPSPSLANIMPRLKLTRARILVLGCGPGNDAAWFAELGHLVTAVDFSEEAIKEATKRYGNVRGLEFLQCDAFNLPKEFKNSFDIVFEHTCYCAITPSRRNELVRVWRQALAENGHLMGIFFTMDKRFGPPYGGSEWEIRSRLQKNFRALYWTRLHDSIEKRIGQELFVYAQKLVEF